MDNKVQKKRYYLPAVKKLRLLLMICAILYTYGFYGSLGAINDILFGFAFPALYIISGYIVLRKSPNIEKRILRTIGRTAICFVILFAVYFGLSLLADKAGTLALVTTKRFWIDFLLFNICSLPIGSTIWFVQALLYAYIIIYVIYKLRLLRFDIVIAALCLVVTVISGELSSVVGFHLLGHSYLGGNFLTRALPYILIGCFIHRKKMYFASLRNIHYVIIFSAGASLAIVESLVLLETGNDLYFGHLLGMGLIAVVFCMFCLFRTRMDVRSKPLKNLSRFELAIPYYVCSPLYYVMALWLSSSKEYIKIFGDIAGIITLFFSIIALVLYVVFRLLVFKVINGKRKK